MTVRNWKMALTISNSSMDLETTDATTSQTFLLTFAKVLKGDKGDKGDTGATGPAGPAGTGISSIVEYYKATASNSAPSAASVISDDCHAAPDNYGSSYPYLWKIERTNKTDGTYSDSEVILAGHYGVDGAPLWPVMSVTSGMHLTVNTQATESTDRFSLGSDGHLKINM